MKNQHVYALAAVLCLAADAAALTSGAQKRTPTNPPSVQTQKAPPAHPRVDQKPGSTGQRDAQPSHFRTNQDSGSFRSGTNGNTTRYQPSGYKSSDHISAAVRDRPWHASDQRTRNADQHEGFGERPRDPARGGQDPWHPRSQGRDWNDSRTNPKEAHERAHDRPLVRYAGSRFHDRDWRYGYHGDRDGGGTHFTFGFYLSSPYVLPCVVSPWYWYPALPPYLPADRVVVIEGTRCDWDAGATIDYSPGNSEGSFGNAALNGAIDALQAVYVNRDQQAVSSLVPGDGRVAFYTDGKYAYSLDGSDFQQMIVDNCKDTQTTSFKVTSVRMQGDQAIVRCTHEFTEADQGTDTVYQLYKLRQVGDTYVITDFMAGHEPYTGRMFF